MKSLKESLAKKFNLNIKDLNERLDGRIEWICKHGIGHTIWYPKNSTGTHGCDGCCRELKKRKR